MKGEFRPERTGVNTISIFGYQMRFLLKGDVLPVITTKKIHLKSVIGELLWFLNGGSNVRDLQKNGISIWDEWADEEGSLGPVYGKQWRSWNGSLGQSIDQISSLIEEIKRNPSSRRLIVSSWNVAELKEMALPPCHLLFQFYVQDGRISCQLYQRSADAFLGVPFNITSYALLTHLIARECDLVAHEFVWSGGDCHIYLNHIHLVKQQLLRRPFPLPQLNLRRRKDLFSYKIDDVILENYLFHPFLRGKVAV